MSKIICIVVLLFGSMGFAEGEMTPQEQLMEAHDQLYNIDFRKLEHDELRVYLTALDTIKSVASESLCKSPATKSIVFNAAYTYRVSWSNCSTLNLDTKSLLEVVTQDGIRDCYAKGYSECSEKLPARLKGKTTIDANSADAKCEVEFDMVISATE